MRYPASEKLEIIRTLEASHLPVRQTLAMLGIAFALAVGHVCDLFSDEECYNFFNAAGYRTD